MKESPKVSRLEFIEKCEERQTLCANTTRKEYFEVTQANMAFDTVNEWLEEIGLTHYTVDTYNQCLSDEDKQGCFTLLSSCDLASVDTFIQATNNLFESKINLESLDKRMSNAYYSDLGFSFRSKQATMLDAWNFSCRYGVFGFTEKFHRRTQMAAWLKQRAQDSDKEVLELTPMHYDFIYNSGAVPTKSWPDCGF